jgi:hypothetical protein
MPRPVSMNTEICNLISTNQSIIDDVALFKKEKVMNDYEYMEICKNNKEMNEIVGTLEQRNKYLEDYVERLEKKINELHINAINMKSSRFYRKTMDINYDKRQYCRKEDKLIRYRNGDTSIKRCTCGELLIECYKGGMEEHLRTAKHRDFVERMKLKSTDLVYKEMKGKSIDKDLDKIDIKLLLSSHLKMKYNEWIRRETELRRQQES